MSDSDTTDGASDAEPVDTTVRPDPRVFPIELGNETALNIDGLEAGRVRIGHKEGQIVVAVAEEDWECNREIEDTIEIPLTEEREHPRR